MCDTIVMAIDMFSRLWGGCFVIPPRFLFWSLIASSDALKRQDKQNQKAEGREKWHPCLAFTPPNGLQRFFRRWMSGSWFLIRGIEHKYAIASSMVPAQFAGPPRFRSCRTSPKPKDTTADVTPSNSVHYSFKQISPPYTFHEAIIIALPWPSLKTRRSATAGT